MSQTATAGKEPTIAPESLEELPLPRVLGSIDGPKPGPTLIVVGGLHGNEPAGVKALQGLLPRLAADPTGIVRGRIVGLSGNRQALLVKQRYVVHDLNRYWLPEQVERLRATSAQLTGEDRELKELDLEIERLQSEATGSVYLLDLHTTSAPERSFATLDDTLRNRPFAFAFPAPVVLGLEEELAGTLNSYAGSLGIITAGFESGRHEDSAAVERAIDAVWIALEASGVVEAGSRSEVESARRRLAAESAGLPAAVEIRYRHAIEPADEFRMDDGHENFQPVTAGQHLGTSHGLPVKAPISGLLLMPLYQDQGADGFFIVRRVWRIWLGASVVVRRWRLERFLHWLPGVRRHEELAGTFIVDRRYARWLAPELFHLLGFTRQGALTRFLTMTRRRDDH